MKSKNIRRLIAVNLVAALIFLYPTKGQASVSSDIYSKPISIGFTSMGNINTVDFSVTDSYFILNHEITLKSGAQYRIQLTSNKLNLFENGNLLLQTDSDITILPINSNTYIKFAKNKRGSSQVCFFPGSMIFQKNDQYILPINKLQMEDYIKGVVPYEVSDSFNTEALKAQAIATRTYAVKNKGKHTADGYDLQDSTSDQVYDGIDLNSKGTDISPKSTQAVASTKGIVLTYNSNPIDAFFSASNGGYTETAQDVWGGSSVPYLVSTQDIFENDQLGNNRPWTSTKTNADIETLLKQKHPELNIKSFVNIDVSQIQYFTNSPRIKYLPINYLDNQGIQKTFTIGKDASENEARTLFGFQSTLYSVSNANGVYTFNGKGSGHGIGMSQEGANARANSSQNYSTILNFYFPNTNEENASNNSSIASLKLRIGGIDRYSTSKLIAESYHNDNINNVVIATGLNYPDALAGSTLAKQLNAPILLISDSPDDGSSAEAINYINSHLNKSGIIYILGGQGVISSSFEKKFNDLGFKNITRLGGIDRQETAYKIANALPNIPKTSPVVIATQNDFPDALSMSPVAALNGYPMLLSDKDNLGTEAENYLATNRPSKVYIAGGSGVISDNVKNRIKSILGYSDSNVVRLGGIDRYETSRIINSEFFTNPSEVMVATGSDFPDALSGSVYAASKNSPIVLADSTSSIEAEKYVKYLGKNSNNVQISVFGLQGAVSDGIISDLVSIKR